MTFGFNYRDRPYVFTECDVVVMKWLVLLHTYSSFSVQRYLYELDVNEMGVKTFMMFYSSSVFHS